MPKYAFIAVTAAIVTLAAAVLISRSESVPAIAEIPSETALPVLMYHSVLSGSVRTGEYVISPELLEDDLKYLSEHDYTAVSPRMIADYCQNGTPLPEKPILITFDDGHLNNLTYALPLLEKYDMRAVVSVVGAFTVQAEKENDPNPIYAYLTRDDIAALMDSGRFFIGCHTYNMHSLNGRKGASKNSGESAEEYTALFREDTDKWRELMGEDISSQAIVYAYPYGFSSEEGFPVLSDSGFEMILTCRERVSVLRRDQTEKGDIITLDRYNRTGVVQTDKFMQEHEIY